MRRSVRRFELPIEDKVSLIGKNHISIDSKSSVVAYCTAVYPDLLMAKVEGQNIGARILPYDPDSAIRVGTMVIITSSSNIPRITGKLHFGTTVDKSIILDIDPLPENPFIYKNTSVPDWSEDDGEHLAHHPIIIKHLPGEKVYNVDFSGLKIGHTKTSLFFGPQARIELSKGNVSVVSENIFSLSKAGSLKYMFDDDATYTASKNTMIEDDVFFDFIREYKGDVKRALKDDNLAISGYTPDDISTKIDESVWLTFILDDRDYIENIGSVGHRYKNRKLNITGDSSGSPIHTEMKKKARISDNFLKSSAIIATIDGEEYSVVYLKSINRSGDMYEYNSGDNVSVVRGDDYNLYNNRDTFILGDDKEYFQRNKMLSQFPVSYSSIYSSDIFATNIVSNRGDVVETNYRYKYTTNINVQNMYDISKESGIETLETNNSPVVVNSHQRRTDDVSDMGYNGSIGYFKTIKEDGKSLNETITSDGFSVSITDGEKEGSISIGTDSVYIKSENNISVDAKQISLKSDQTHISGKAIISGGIESTGVFSIDAENILLKSRKNIYMLSNDMYAGIRDSITMTFSKDATFHNTTEASVENIDHVKTLFIISDNSIVTQADSVIGRGIDEISMTATKRAVFGAEQLSLLEDTK